MEEEILERLEQPSRLSATLRALKNDIVGHEQNKEKWTSRGILNYLEKILRAYCTSSRAGNGEYGISAEGAVSSTVIDEGVCLQAITIVDSLAYGGPRYLPPLNAGQLLSVLLHMLCPTDFPPAVLLATLRTLNTIADCAALAEPVSVGVDEGFVEALYAGSNLTNLALIFGQRASSPVVQQQISFTAALICKTCRQETQRELLASVGILEALAAQLAPFLVATGTALLYCDPGDCIGADSSPATLRSSLTPVLQAIASVITDSKDRTSQFVCAPALTAVFPWRNADPYAWRAPAMGTDKRLLESPRSLESKNLSSSPKLSNLNTTFPPLNHFATLGKQQRTERPFQSPRSLSSIDQTGIKEDDETPLFGWLLEIIRSELGMTRLIGTWVLSLLFRAGLASPRRERSLSMLVIPVVVWMLENEPTSQKMEPCFDDFSILQAPSCLMKELAPRILALLVADSPDLQRAAADAGVIRRLSQLLKQSHDPLPATQSTSLWAPSLEASRFESMDADCTLKLGAAGLMPAEYHTLQVRESVLLALAAMASCKDEYRKAIIDSGVVPFVIESLKPRASSEIATEPTKTTRAASAKPGNPTYVLLAACAAARALSRSVSTLRTSLMDAGLATPLQILIKSPMVEVQIAATAVIANIVLEFSPMRDVVIDAGVLKTLCEHAHSQNAKLKLQSIWALKHLVHSASNPLKMACLRELGPSWLMQLLHINAREHPPFAAPMNGDDGATSIAPGTPNAAGEQVDLLNAIDDESQASASAHGVLDGDEHEDVDDEEVNMIDSIGALSRPHSHSRITQEQDQSHHTSNLGEQVESDFGVARMIGRDDLAVLEHGLDFIRNLICGPDSAEMIDFVFDELGQDRLFETLAALLRPRPIEFITRERKMSGFGVKYVAPQSEIVVAACFVLVHIAAGLPRHRQVLLSQTELMKTLIPLFTHTTSEVRSCCAWVVINLTWMEDQGDKVQSRNRALELSKLGVLEQLRRLEGDPVLNVRERIKQALQQMGELLQR